MTVVHVGQRDLDGLVDATRASSHSRLQHVGPVGGEHEEEVGVVVDAVEELEQGEERIA